MVFVMKRERVDERIERTAGDFFHNKGCSDYFFSFRSDVYFYSERVSLFLSLSFSLSLSLSQEHRLVNNDYTDFCACRLDSGYPTRRLNTRGGCFCEPKNKSKNPKARRFRAST